MTGSGIGDALARIAAIQSRMSGAAPAAAPTAAPTAASFASLLADELTRSTSAAGGPVGSGVLGWPTPASTALGSAMPAGAAPGGAPAVFGAYGNGNIPVSALVPIQQGDEYLWAPAASAFEQMVAAAARDGVSLRVSDGYRTLDEQAHLADELGLYSQGGLAAVPGTSQHGWGVAIDLELDDASLAWMRANGAAHGFHETVAREPWHWEFVG